MSKQFSIAKIFLRLFVIALGITLDAGLYETSVVTPLRDVLETETVFYSF